MPHLLFLLLLLLLLITFTVISPMFPPFPFRCNQHQYRQSALGQEHLEQPHQVRLGVLFVVVTSAHSDGPLGFFNGWAPGGLGGGSTEPPQNQGFHQACGCPTTEAGFWPFLALFHCEASNFLDSKIDLRIPPGARGGFKVENKSPGWHTCFGVVGPSIVLALALLCHNTEQMKRRVFWNEIACHRRRCCSLEDFLTLSS